MKMQSSFSEKEETWYSQSAAELLTHPTTKPKAREDAGTAAFTEATVHRSSHQAPAKMLWEKEEIRPGLLLKYQSRKLCPCENRIGFQATAPKMAKPALGGWAAS